MFIANVTHVRACSDRSQATRRQSESKGESYL